MHEVLPRLVCPQTANRDVTWPDQCAVKRKTDGGQETQYSPKHHMPSPKRLVIVQGRLEVSDEHHAHQVGLDVWMIIYNARKKLPRKYSPVHSAGVGEKGAYIFTRVHCKKYNELITHTRARARTHAHTHARTHAHARTHTHTHTHTHKHNTHSHRHTHTHTRTHTLHYTTLQLESKAKKQTNKKGLNLTRARFPCKSQTA